MQSTQKETVPLAKTGNPETTKIAVSLSDCFSCQKTVTKRNPNKAIENGLPTSICICSQCVGKPQVWACSVCGYEREDTKFLGMVPFCEGCQKKGRNGSMQLSVEALKRKNSEHLEKKQKTQAELEAPEKSPSSLGQLLEQVSAITITAKESVSSTGEAAWSTTTAIGHTVSHTALQVTHQATQQVGQVVNFVSDNPLLQRAAGLAKSDWLLGVVNQVDIEKVAEEVERIRKAHPDESPRQLAHRVMVTKTLFAGGLGLASSLIPGSAAALFAVDLAATTALQAEMVYQIAILYGLNPLDSARKGEVLAIFGLSLGGQKAMQAGGSYIARAGLTAVLENIPVAGAVIGASSNAALNYAIGYAACNFYEAKIDTARPTPLESEEALQAAEQKGEQYLEGIIEQQRVMDQIMAHAVLLAYPEEQWEDIVPELKQLNLQEDSLEAIANHLQDPQPIHNLLEQLSPDFAVPLLAQCQYIANRDQMITSQEKVLLDSLHNRVFPPEIISKGKGLNSVISRHKRQQKRDIKDKAEMTAQTAIDLLSCFSCQELITKRNPNKAVENGLPSSICICSKCVGKKQIWLCSACGHEKEDTKFFGTTPFCDACQKKGKNGSMQLSAEALKQKNLEHLAKTHKQQAKLEELEIEEKALKEKASKILVTTAPSVDCYNITSYRGLVTGSAISKGRFPAGDNGGGAEASLQDALQEATTMAYEALRVEAAKKGVNAVIAANVTYIGNKAIIITVTGTAVILTKGDHHL